MASFRTLAVARSPLLIVFALASGLAAGCAGSGQEAPPPPPVLTSLLPERAVSTTTFLLTVSGSGFQSGSRIVFNGRSMTTTVTNSGELSCTVTPADMAVKPSSSQIVAVPVSVTGPGVAGSNSLTFQVAVYPAFQAAVKIADAATAQYDTLRPLVRMDNAGRLYVVWRDREDLRFSRSVDAGVRWSPPVTLHTSVNSSYRFSTAIDGSGASTAIDGSSASPTLVVVWEEGPTIRAMRSTDAGQTWTTPSALTSPTTVRASNPGMFVDRVGTIFVAYLAAAPAGGAPYAVVVLRSPNHGASFDEIGRVPWHTYFSGDSSPQLAADGNGTLCLVFTSEFGTRYAMSYSTFSSDGGRTWSAPNRVSVVAPALAVDDQNAVDVVGANMYLPFLYRVTFLRSTDQGVTWATHDFDGTNYADASLVVNTFRSVDVVWAHQFVRSFDRGATWGPVVAYDEETAASRPSLAEDASGRIFLVWWDTRGGIYFKASTPPPA